VKPKKAGSSATREVKRPPKKRAKKEKTTDSDRDDDTPKPKAAKRKRAIKMESDAEKSLSEDAKPPTKKTSKKIKDEPASSEIPKVKKKVKKENEVTTPKKGRGKKREQEEEPEEVFKWWEAENPEGDGTVKWQTLEHNGVIFPPPYEPLPSNIRMKYNGIQVQHLWTTHSHNAFKVNSLTFHQNRKKLPGSTLRCWIPIMQRMPSLTRTSSRIGRKSSRNIRPLVPCSYDAYYTLIAADSVTAS
jgi:hypothetical protein